MGPGVIVVRHIYAWCVVIVVVRADPFAIVDIFPFDLCFGLGSNIDSDGELVD